MNQSSTLSSYMQERQQRDFSGAFASAAALVILFSPMNLYSMEPATNSVRMTEVGNNFLIAQRPFLRKSVLGKYRYLGYSTDEYLKQKRKDATFE